MTTTRRIATALALLLLPIHLYAAQADERGAYFIENFQGSSNADGVILKENSTLGFKFNQHVQAYVGLPVYFVHQKSSSTSSASFVNGIGNAFTGLTLSANKSSWFFTSDVIGTAPTGKRSHGFSTGHATVDWTNSLSRPIKRFTPFGSVGLANTISDTSFFVRPFTSQGVVGHFEGGGILNVFRQLNIGASGYAVRAHGKQEVASKVVTQKEPAPANTPVSSLIPGRRANLTNAGTETPVFETQTVVTGVAAIANDAGFSTWMSVKPTSPMNLIIGYSHSSTYQFDSLFFGIGYRFGH